MFYFDKINNKKVLKSTMLEETEHFYTTKESFIKTANPEQIPIAEANKKNVCSYLKIKEENLICPQQTHSANIEIISSSNHYPNCDALILDNRQVAIYLSFADCTPIILYDTKKDIVSTIHAGWRGSAQKIAYKTVQKMKEIFDTNPLEIKAAIFPCICFKCFETGDAVIKELSKSVKDDSELFNQNYADLKGINARQLMEAGVGQIDISPYCTCCNNDLFFSYRKENKTTSRNSLVVKLF